ncbi:MAG: RagB/SusD family nutrient uptake outer membrane protein [Bacteroidales bacterium]|nr:RagB/SusD family nutrient uptake outer membrane protein [Bacteroidales bacterium]
MKKKYIIGCLIAAASTFGLASCSDFLDEDPKGTITEETFYKSQNDLDMAMYAIYSLVQSYQCNSNPMIVDCQGSDVTSTTGSNKAAYLAADAFEEPSDTKGIEQLWSAMYKIIKASNSLIMNADNAATSETEINIAKGNAYFWRAYCYFNLVRYYGPVVLNLTNENDYNQSPLSSVADVYAQIISDLEAADKCNLPAKYTTEPRAVGGANNYVSAQAVKAALAAVYLHKGGWPLNDTSAYAQAAAYAKQVIDGVNNGTYDQAVVDWGTVYDYGQNYNNGCILGIDYYTRAGGWASYDSQLTCCHQSGKLWAGWGDFLAERYFWSNYPDGPRKRGVYSETINVGGVYPPSTNSVSWWATTDEKAYDGTNQIAPDYRPMFVGYSLNADDYGAYITGAWDCSKPVWTGMCLDKRHQLIRYSEVLCWYAEAVGRGGSSDISGAQSALRQVREVAYDAGDAKIAECSNLTGTALAEAAAYEHMYEVAGNTLGMVTVRSDELRLNLLESVWSYRHGSQSSVLVPKGTLTYSIDANNNPYTYTLSYDVVVPEEMSVSSSWNGDKSIYMQYPPTEYAKNPNLVR